MEAWAVAALVVGCTFFLLTLLILAYLLCRMLRARAPAKQGFDNPLYEKSPKEKVLSMRTLATAEAQIEHDSLHLASGLPVEWQPGGSEWQPPSAGPHEIALFVGQKDSPVTPRLPPPPPVLRPARTNSFSNPLFDQPTSEATRHLSLDPDVTRVAQQHATIKATFSAEVINVAEQQAQAKSTLSTPERATSADAVGPGALHLEGITPDSVSPDLLNDELTVTHVAAIGKSEVADQDVVKINIEENKTDADNYIYFEASAENCPASNSVVSPKRIAPPKPSRASLRRARPPSLDESVEETLSHQVDDQLIQIVVGQATPLTSDPATHIADNLVTAICIVDDKATAVHLTEDQAMPPHLADESIIVIEESMCESMAPTLQFSEDADNKQERSMEVRNGDVLESIIVLPSPPETGDDIVLPTPAETGDCIILPAPLEIGEVVVLPTPPENGETSETYTQQDLVIDTPHNLGTLNISPTSVSISSSLIPQPRSGQVSPHRSDSNDEGSFAMIDDSSRDDSFDILNSDSEVNPEGDEADWPNEDECGYALPSQLREELTRSNLSDTPPDPMVDSAWSSKSDDIITVCSASQIEASGITESERLSPSLTELPPAPDIPPVPETLSDSDDNCTPPPVPNKPAELVSQRLVRSKSFDGQDSASADRYLDVPAESAKSLSSDELLEFSRPTFEPESEFAERLKRRREKKLQKEIKTKIPIKKRKSTAERPSIEILSAVPLSQNSARAAPTSRETRAMSPEEIKKMVEDNLKRANVRKSKKIKVKMQGFDNPNYEESPPMQSVFYDEELKADETAKDDVGSKDDGVAKEDESTSSSSSSRNSDFESASDSEIANGDKDNLIP